MAIVIAILSTEWCTYYPVTHKRQKSVRRQGLIQGCWRTSFRAHYLMRGINYLPNVEHPKRLSYSRHY